MGVPPRVETGFDCLLNGKGGGLVPKRTTTASVRKMVGALGGRNEKRPERGVFTGVLAEWTGLEPATPGVTGRYSNQLNYHSW